MDDLKKQIQEFERKLDAELAARKMFHYDPAEILVSAAGLISTVYSQLNEHEGNRALVGEFERGLKVALPTLITSKSNRPLETGYSLAELMDDLRFMSHYYMLREYLYYSYNAPGSFRWNFDSNRVQISFNDRSIIRQFAQYANSRILELIEAHDRHHSLGSRIVDLLKGQDELGSGGSLQEAFALVEQEAESRLSLKFNLLDKGRSTVKLKGYNYEQFLSVYRFLLAKCLYHRHYARANDTWPAFRFNKLDLVWEISMNTGLDGGVIERIVRDISYSKKSAKMPPMYFSIIDHERLDEYIFIPDLFIVEDGPAQMLRAQATRSPERFLSDISGPLGDTFVHHLASLFEDAGFFVRQNVSLHGLDPTLPDIDLLVVSREATLGYFVFVCEVKATLPALWAKDFLRVLRTDSLPKAFLQVEKIREALRTDGGADLLMREILAMDNTPMKEGVVPVRGLIISSHNSGMFFDELSEKIQIIDHHTLSQIVQRCDGDVVYILSHLKSLRDKFDVEPHELALEIGNLSVTYEVVTEGDVVPFAQAEWKSVGADVTVAEAFYEGGGSPFDVIGGNPFNVTDACNENRPSSDAD